MTSRLNVRRHGPKTGKDKGSLMQEVVAIDIGGTHARFAVAKIADGRVTELAPEVTLRTADHASLALAWRAFAQTQKNPLPRQAGIAIACPIQGNILKMTNNPWVIQPDNLKHSLGLDDFVLINDFGAVAHAVAQVDDAHLKHLCGSDAPLPETGSITVVGPGTGFGAACLLRQSGRYDVIETEGGHIDFAPLDRVEDRILTELRGRFTRVSAERIVSGPGLSNLYEVIAEMHGAPASIRHNRELWDQAIRGNDDIAAAALERFCLSLGSISGDLALAHGAQGVVIAGGVGLRLADHLPHSGFAERFIAKGRFETMMSRIPVKIITYHQPGLLGAAAAYANRRPA